MIHSYACVEKFKAMWWSTNYVLIRSLFISRQLLFQLSQLMTNQTTGFSTSIIHNFFYRRALPEEQYSFDLLRIGTFKDLYKVGHLACFDLKGSECMRGRIQIIILGIFSQKGSRTTYIIPLHMVSTFNYQN